jgi:hypothetical protein
MAEPKVVPLTLDDLTRDLSNDTQFLSQPIRPDEQVEELVQQENPNLQPEITPGVPQEFTIDTIVRSDVYATPNLTV